MVTLVRHDLEFILQQIRIAEAHAAGTPLTELVDSPLFPYGLRTVDGSYNNLTEGRETWGQSGQPFPRMSEPDYRNEGDDALMFGTPANTCTLPRVKPGAMDTGLSISVAPSGMRAMRCRASLKGRPWRS